MGAVRRVRIRVRVRARTRARSWARLDLHDVGAVLEGPPVLVSVYRKLKQGVGAAPVR